MAWEGLIQGGGPVSAGGGGGGSDVDFTFTQSTPATTWTIAHGLGKKPSVTVLDNSGDEIFGDVSYVDDNNLTIEFSAAVVGTAELN